MAKNFINKYPQESVSSFSVFETNKKLTIRGKDIKFNEQKFPEIKNLLTRIYFTVPTKNAPEIFEKMFQCLDHKKDVLNKIDLVLNLETFQGDLEEDFQNNTVIIYIYDNDPLLKEKIIKGIGESKKSSELWNMPNQSIIKSKEDIAKDFMIPLDDTTAFVESDNIQSYHSGQRGEMFKEITGEMPWSKVDLKELAEKFKIWNPDRPGLFSHFQKRKKYMPALVFEKN